MRSKFIETIRSDLSERQIGELRGDPERYHIGKLFWEGMHAAVIWDSDGCWTENFGIWPNTAKENSPKIGGHYLPVGFIRYIFKTGVYKIDLVNLDEEFPVDYHSRLREIIEGLEN